MTSYQSSEAINSNVWTHITVVLNKTKNKINFYRDNVLEGSFDASDLNLINNTNSIYIGNNQNDYFDGLLDDVRIYDRAITSDEVQNLYNLKTENDLILKYDFEQYDYSANIVYDESKNTSHGILENKESENNDFVKDIGEYAVNGTAFNTDIDQYIKISTDTSNVVQGNNLDNCTFTAWVKTNNVSSFEPIIHKEGVFSFGLNYGHATLKLGDGNILHDLPAISSMVMTDNDVLLTNTNTSYNNDKYNINIESIYGIGDTDYMFGNNSTTNLTNFTEILSTYTSNINIYSIGNTHGCFLTKDYQLYMFGKNQYGEFGNSLTANVGHIPTNISVSQFELKDILQISCGRSTTFILLQNGDVYGTGYNAQGQLGQNNTTNLNTFTKIPINEKVIKVLSGAQISLFLTVKKKIYFCGQGNPNGNNTNHTTPTLCTITESIIDMACTAVTCAFLTENKYLYMCGERYLYQLGDNNTSGHGVHKHTTYFQPGSDHEVVKMVGSHRDMIIITKSKQIWQIGNNAVIQNANKENGIGYPNRFLRGDQESINGSKWFQNCYKLIVYHASLLVQTDDLELFGFGKYNTNIYTTFKKLDILLPENFGKNILEYNAFEGAVIHIIVGDMELIKPVLTSIQSEKQLIYQKYDNINTNAIIYNTEQVLTKGHVEGNLGLEFSNDQFLKLPINNNIDLTSLTFGAWIYPTNIDNVKSIFHAKITETQSISFNLNKNMLELTFNNDFTSDIITNINAVKTYERTQDMFINLTNFDVFNTNDLHVYVLNVGQLFKDDLFKKSPLTDIQKKIIYDFAKESNTQVKLVGKNTKETMHFVSNKYLRNFNDFTFEKNSYDSNFYTYIIVEDLVLNDIEIIQFHNTSYTHVDTYKNKMDKNVNLFKDGNIYDITKYNNEETRNDDKTDWYLVANYLHATDIAVTYSTRKSVKHASDDIVGFPLERTPYDSLIMNANEMNEFESEDYVTNDSNNILGGPWGHIDNNLFNNLVLQLGDTNIEMLFRGKTTEHNREMDFITNHNYLIETFRNGAHIDPGNTFEDIYYTLNEKHSTNLPKDTTSLTTTHDDIALIKQTLFNSTYFNKIGEVNVNHWGIDTNTSTNNDIYYQIWVRGRKELFKLPKPQLLSNNDYRNKTKTPSATIVGEKYTVTLHNGDIVTHNKYHTNMSMNLFINVLTSFCQGDTSNTWKCVYEFKKQCNLCRMMFWSSISNHCTDIDIYYSNDENVNVDSDLTQWIKVDQSIPGFFNTTNNFRIDIDFPLITTNKVMIEVHGTGYNALGEWRMYGYDTNMNGIISDCSELNDVRHSKIKHSGVDFNDTERNELVITPTTNEYYEFIYNRFRSNPGNENSTFSDTNSRVIKAVLNNYDTIYYTCRHSKTVNVGWTAYEGTHVFTTFTMNNYTTTATTYNNRWLFPTFTGGSSNYRVGSIVYEFSNGDAYKLSAIKLWASTELYGNIRIFTRPMGYTSNTDFVEYKNPVHVIENTDEAKITENEYLYIELGEDIPVTNAIYFEIQTQITGDIYVRHLNFIGKLVSNGIKLSVSNVQLTDNVITFDTISPFNSTKAYIKTYTIEQYEHDLTLTHDIDVLKSDNKQSYEFTINDIITPNGVVNNFYATNNKFIYVIIFDEITGEKATVLHKVESSQTLPYANINTIQYQAVEYSYVVDITAFSSKAKITSYYYAMFKNESVLDISNEVLLNFIIDNKSSCSYEENIEVSIGNVMNKQIQVDTLFTDMLGNTTQELNIDDNLYSYIVVFDELNRKAIYTTQSSLNSYIPLRWVKSGGHDSNAQMGHGTTGDKSFNDSTALNTWLTTYPNLHIKEIIGGGYHTILWVVNDGKNELYGFGRNSEYQLGDGTTTQRNTPTLCSKVSEYMTTNNVDIQIVSCGYHHTLVLFTNGVLCGFGLNTQYELGNNSATNSVFTECIKINEYSTTHNVKIVNCTGTRHSSLVLYSDNTVHGIGNNVYGQFGINNRTDYNNVLKECTSVNIKLSEGYTINLMNGMQIGVLYQLKKDSDNTLEWWGVGENSYNGLGINGNNGTYNNLTKSQYLEDFLNTLEDKSNVLFSKGHMKGGMYIHDKTTGKTYSIGQKSWTGFPDSTSYVEISGLSAQTLGTVTNPITISYIATNNHGVFIAGNDPVLDVKPVSEGINTKTNITTNMRINNLNAQINPSGISFSAEIIGSINNDTNIYTLATTYAMTPQDVKSKILANTDRHFLNKLDIESTKSYSQIMEGVYDIKDNYQLSKSINYCVIWVYLNDGTNDYIQQFTIEKEIASIVSKVVSINFNVPSNLFENEITLFSTFSSVTQYIFGIFESNYINGISESDVQNYLLNNSNDAIITKSISTLKNEVYIDNVSTSKVINYSDGSINDISEYASYTIFLLGIDENNATNVFKSHSYIPRHLQLYKGMKVYTPLSWIKSAGQDTNNQMGHGVNLSIKQWNDASVINTWLATYPKMHIKEIIGGGDFTLLWCVNNGNNELYGIGLNTSYQLGDGTLTRMDTPQLCSKVSEYMELNDTDIDKIYCGWDFTTILFTNNVLCGFGTNAYYQLSNNSTTKSSFTECTNINEYCNANNLVILDFTCTGYETFVLFSNNKLFAIGLNNHGEFGIGNATNYGNVLTEITTVNDLLTDGYTIDLMLGRNNHIQYRLMKNGKLEWWGCGENRHNTSLGISGVNPERTLVKLNLLENLINSFEDPMQYIISKGMHHSGHVVHDILSGKTYYIGYFTNGFTDSSSYKHQTTISYEALSTVTNPITISYIATNGYGLFIGGNEPKLELQQISLDTIVNKTSQIITNIDSILKSSLTNKYNLSASIIYDNILDTNFSIISTTSPNYTIDDIKQAFEGNSNLLESGNNFFNINTSVDDVFEINGNVVSSKNVNTIYTHLYTKDVNGDSLYSLSNVSESNIYPSIDKIVYDHFNDAYNVSFGLYTSTLKSINRYYLTTFDSNLNNTTSDDIINYMISNSNLDDVVFGDVNVNQYEVFTSNVVFDKAFVDFDGNTSTLSEDKVYDFRIVCVDNEGNTELNSYKYIEPPKSYIAFDKLRTTGRNAYKHAMHTNTANNIALTEATLFTNFVNDNQHLVIIDITSGEWHSIIWTRDDGEDKLFGIGYNGEYPLGILDTNGNPNNSHQQTVVECNAWNQFFKINNLSIKKIVCMYRSTLILCSDNTIYGVGQNNNYQLGLGNNTNPIKIISEATLFTQYCNENNVYILDLITVGVGCLVYFSNNQAYYVGQNNYNHLASGNTTNATTSILPCTSLNDKLNEGYRLCEMYGKTLSSQFKLINQNGDFEWWGVGYNVNNGLGVTGAGTKISLSRLDLIEKLIHGSIFDVSYTGEKLNSPTKYIFVKGNSQHGTLIVDTTNYNDIYKLGNFDNNNQIGNTATFAKLSSTYYKSTLETLSTHPMTPVFYSISYYNLFIGGVTPDSLLNKVIIGEALDITNMEINDLSINKKASKNITFDVNLNASSKGMSTWYVLGTIDMTMTKNEAKTFIQNNNIQSADINIDTILSKQVLSNVFDVNGNEFPSSSVNSLRIFIYMTDSFDEIIYTNEYYTDNNSVHVDFNDISFNYFQNSLSAQMTIYNSGNTTITEYFTGLSLDTLYSDTDHLTMTNVVSILPKTMYSETITFDYYIDDKSTQKQLLRNISYNIYTKTVDDSSVSEFKEYNLNIITYQPFRWVKSGGANSSTYYQLGQSGNGNQTFDDASVINDWLITNPKIKILEIKGGNTFTLFLVDNEGKQEMWSIGYNNYGQLAIGDTITTNIIKKSTLINDFMDTHNVTVKSYVCGGSNFTIVLFSNGKLYGIGHNNVSQLATGNTTNSGSQLVECSLYNNYCIVNDVTIELITVTNNTTFVYFSNNKVFGSGYNSNYEMARGNNTNTNNTILECTQLNVKLSEGYTVNWMQGGWHSMQYRLTSKLDGTYSWWGVGYNHYRYLGTAQNHNSNITTLKSLELLETLINTELTDPSKYEMAVGLHYSATMIIDTVNGDVWKIGHFNEIGFGNPTSFNITQEISNDTLLSTTNPMVKNKIFMNHRGVFVVGNHPDEPLQQIISADISIFGQNVSINSFIVEKDEKTLKYETNVTTYENNSRMYTLASSSSTLTKQEAKTYMIQNIQSENVEKNQTITLSENIITTVYDSSFTFFPINTVNTCYIFIYITDDITEDILYYTYQQNVQDIYPSIVSHGYNTFEDALYTNISVYGTNESINAYYVVAFDSEEYTNLTQTESTLLSDSTLTNGDNQASTSSSLLNHYQVLSNSDKVHASHAHINERTIASLFDGVLNSWGNSWHGPSGTLSMEAIYEFVLESKSVNEMKFSQVPGASNYTGKITIYYWNGSEYIEVSNPSQTGFINAVYSETITISFDIVTSDKFKILINKHDSNNTTYVGLSEWQIIQNIQPFNLQNYIVTNKSLGAIHFDNVTVNKGDIFATNVIIRNMITNAETNNTSIITKQSDYTLVIVGTNETKQVLNIGVKNPTESYIPLRWVKSGGYDPNYQMGHNGTTTHRGFNDSTALNTWLTTYPNLHIKEIIGGGYHTILWVVNDGKHELYGFGRNSNGELGDGTTTQRSTPTLCSNVDEYMKTNNVDIKNIKCGWHHTIVLFSNDVMYGFGNNSQHQLGDNTATNSTFTECVEFMEYCNTNSVSILDFSCGNHNTFLYFSDNTLYAIGTNTYGYFGNGNKTNSPNLTACTSVNTKLGEGYTLRFMLGNYHISLYQFEKTSDGSYEWWGCGYNTYNAAGINSNGTQYTTIQRSVLLETFLNTIDKENMIFSKGCHHSGHVIHDITSGKTYMIGHFAYTGLGDPTTYTEKTALSAETLGTATNPITISHISINGYGIFIAGNDPVLDVKPIFNSNQNVINITIHDIVTIDNKVMINAIIEKTADTPTFWSIVGSTDPNFTKYDAKTYFENNYNSMITNTQELIDYEITYVFDVNNNYVSIKNVNNAYIFLYASDGLIEDISEIEYTKFDKAPGQVYINRNSYPLLTSGFVNPMNMRNWTISLWVKFKGLQSVSDINLFQMRSATNHRYINMQLTSCGGDVTHATTRTNNNGLGVRSGHACYANFTNVVQYFEVDVWSHIVIMQDDTRPTGGGDTATYYLNNVQLGTYGEINQSGSETDNVEFGVSLWRYTSGSHVNEVNYEIADIQVFSGINLTTTQINELYLTSKIVSPTVLPTYRWLLSSDFEEISGTPSLTLHPTNPSDLQGTIHGATGRNIVPTFTTTNVYPINIVNNLDIYPSIHKIDYDAFENTFNLSFGVLSNKIVTSLTYYIGAFEKDANILDIQIYMKDNVNDTNIIKSGTISGLDQYGVFTSNVIINNIISNVQTTLLDKNKEYDFTIYVEEGEQLDQLPYINTISYSIAMDSGRGVTISNINYGTEHLSDESTNNTTNSGRQTSGDLYDFFYKVNECVDGGPYIGTLSNGDTMYYTGHVVAGAQLFEPYDTTVGNGLISQGRYTGQDLFGYIMPNVGHRHSGAVLYELGSSSRPKMLALRGFKYRVSHVWGNGFYGDIFVFYRKRFEGYDSFEFHEKITQNTALGNRATSTDLVFTNPTPDANAFLFVFVASNGGQWKELLRMQLFFNEVNYEYAYDVTQVINTLDISNINVNKQDSKITISANLQGSLKQSTTWYVLATTNIVMDQYEARTFILNNNVQQGGVIEIGSSLILDELEIENVHDINGNKHVISSVNNVNVFIYMTDSISDTINNAQIENNDAYPFLNHIIFNHFENKLQIKYSLFSSSIDIEKHYIVGLNSLIFNELSDSELETFITNNLTHQHLYSDESTSVNEDVVYENEIFVTHLIEDQSGSYVEITQYTKLLEYTFVILSIDALDNSILSKYQHKGDMMIPYKFFMGKGDNTNGELGNSSHIGTISLLESNNLNSWITNNPTLIIVDVISGWTHTMLIVKNTATNQEELYGIGKNNYYQRGVLSTTVSSTPIKADIIMTFLETNNLTLHKIRCGGNHTIILCSDGKLYGIGLNNYGQVATGNQTNTGSNVVECIKFNVYVTSNIVEILDFEVGGNETYVYFSNNLVYAIGYGAHYQLGNGSTTIHNVNITPCTHINDKLNNSGYELLHMYANHHSIKYRFMNNGVEEWWACGYNHLSGNGYNGHGTNNNLTICTYINTLITSFSDPTNYEFAHGNNYCGALITDKTTGYVYVLGNVGKYNNQTFVKKDELCVETLKASNSLTPISYHLSNWSVLIGGYNHNESFGRVMSRNQSEQISIHIISSTCTHSKSKGIQLIADIKVKISNDVQYYIIVTENTLHDKYEIQTKIRSAISSGIFDGITTGYIVTEDPNEPFHLETHVDKIFRNLTINTIEDSIYINNCNVYLYIENANEYDMEIINIRNNKPNSVLSGIGNSTNSKIVNASLYSNEQITNYFMLTFTRHALIFQSDDLISQFIRNHTNTFGKQDEKVLINNLDINQTETIVSLNTSGNFKNDTIEFDFDTIETFQEDTDYFGVNKYVIIEIEIGQNIKFNGTTIISSKLDKRIYSNDIQNGSIISYNLTGNYYYYDSTHVDKNAIIKVNISTTVDVEKELIDVQNEYVHCLLVETPITTTLFKHLDNINEYIASHMSLSLSNELTITMNLINNPDILYMYAIASNTTMTKSDLVTFINTQANSPVLFKSTISSGVSKYTISVDNILIDDNVHDISRVNKAYINILLMTTSEFEFGVTYNHYKSYYIESGIVNNTIVDSIIHPEEINNYTLISSGSLYNSNIITDGYIFALNISTISEEDYTNNDKVINFIISLYPNKDSDTMSDALYYVNDISSNTIEYFNDIELTYLFDDMNNINTQSIIDETNTGYIIFIVTKDENGVYSFKTKLSAIRFNVLEEDDNIYKFDHIGGTVSNTQYYYNKTFNNNWSLIIDNNMIMVWSAYANDSTDYTIYAKVLTTSKGYTTYTIHSETSTDYILPCIAQIGYNKFIVVYQRRGQNKMYYNICSFFNTEITIGIQTNITTQTLTNQCIFSIKEYSSNSAIICWDDYNQRAHHYNCHCGRNGCNTCTQWYYDYDIEYVIIDENGTNLKQAVIYENNDTSNHYHKVSNPQVCVTDTNFCVVWQTYSEIYFEIVNKTTYTTVSNNIDINTTGLINWSVNNAIPNVIESITKDNYIVIWYNNTYNTNENNEIWITEISSSGTKVVENKKLNANNENTHFNLGCAQMFVNKDRTGYDIFVLRTTSVVVDNNKTVYRYHYELDSALNIVTTNIFDYLSATNKHQFDIMEHIGTPYMINKKSNGKYQESIVFTNTSTSALDAKQIFEFDISTGELLLN
jgi:alpha-tubulin suppressor-like RCC1 family protein